MKIQKPIPINIVDHSQSKLTTCLQKQILIKLQNIQRHNDKLRVPVNRTGRQKNSPSDLLNKSEHIPTLPSSRIKST